MHTHTAAWVGALRALIEDWPSAVVVAGPGAPDLAEACQSDGAPPIAGEGSGFVVLSRTDLSGPFSGLADLPDLWADLVVLRSMWRKRTEAGLVLRAAARVLRRGGRVLAGEMDVARMMEASAVRYPSRLLYEARPDLAAEVRATTIGRAMLSVEAVRAGFAGVATVDLEEERGIFPSAEAYWQYARGGGWPALAWLAPDDAERTVEGASGDLTRIAPIGPVVDRVPFVAVTGMRR